MNSFLLNLLNSKCIYEFDYPSYYHKRGEMINKGERDIIPMYPNELMSYYHQFKLERDDIKEIVFNKNGYAVLWYLNSICTNNVSLLNSASVLFEQSDKVIRGGINVYKQNGWMTHVLYVFQLISYNFASGKIPSYFALSSEELKIKFKMLHEIYVGLNKSSQLLLNILALIHDIGVVDGVQNHDKDGEKYVVTILDDLNITPQTLVDHGIEFHFNYFVELLKILVANHTLINKVSSEAGDNCIHDIVIKIKERLEKEGSEKDDNNFIFSDLAGILLLIGMADLIAVDDSLFSVEKFELAYSSYLFLNNLFLNHHTYRDKKCVALMRLHEMLYESVYRDLETDSNSYFLDKNIKSDLFWERLYNIYKFEYSTAYLKPLKSLQSVLFIINAIFETLSLKFGNDIFEKCIIRFDASMNSNLFVKAVDMGEFSKCIIALKNNNIADTNIISMSVYADDPFTVFLITK